MERTINDFKLQNSTIVTPAQDDEFASIYIQGESKLKKEIEFVKSIGG